MKPPASQELRLATAERAIVFGNPEKRRYGARLVFQVLHSALFLHLLTL